MKASIVGLGKAGLPLAAVIAESGIDTVGIDIAKERVDFINSGGNPIPEETGLDELLGKVVGNTFKAVSTYEEASDCSTYIVIVPLFIDKETHVPDFSILNSAFENLSKIIKDGDLVVLETTVPVGTTRKFKKILDKSGKDFKLAYSPERIMTGYSISRYKEFPKVVGGINEESTNAAYDFYSNFCSSVEKVSSDKAAELIKISEGVYRDLNIALANELYKVCDSEGLDYREVKEKANHAYCHLHDPGNVGGHCIPVYPWFLINNFDVPLIKQGRLQNDDMVKYYAGKISKDAKKVAVCGLTYREGVKELAYSRSIAMVDHLKDLGYDVFAHDPLMSEEEINSLDINYDNDFTSCDAIILMNKSKEYIDLLKDVDKSKIIDVKSLLA